RALFEQIVIEGDARRAEKSGDIRAHARGLSRRIYFKNLRHGNLICSRHRQNRVANCRIVERLVSVEERFNAKRRNNVSEEREDDDGKRSPNPPAPRRSSKNSVQDRQRNRASDQTNDETNQLFAEPCAERLRGKVVLMFANEELIEGKRKAQDRDDENITDRVNRDLKRFGICRTFGEIAQTRGDFGSEQKNSDCRAN